MEQGLSDAQGDLYRLSLDAPGFSPAAAWIDLFERVPAPSPEELAWASQALEALELSPEEHQRLSAITETFLASRDGLPAPSVVELDWVLELQAEHQAGNPLSPSDLVRLQDICARFWLEQQSRLRELLENLPPSLVNPSEPERAWAREIYQEVLAGAIPSAEDLTQFLQILRACPDLDLHAD